LDTGVIVIDTADSKEISVAVDSGYVKVEEEKTLCVVDGAVALSGDDSELAAKIAEAKELLDKAKNSDTVIAAAKSKVESIGKR